jgi:hypothetical protein
MRREGAGTDRICCGTVLSWEQYLPDVRERGFTDARLHPHGHMTAEEVERWTKAPK